jgi:hypothetical protein
MSVQSLKPFQDQVSDVLIRHRSLLDVMSKFSQTNAAVNRAVTKAITECGCIRVEADKQPYYDPDLTPAQLRLLASTHVKGELCESCMENVVKELGRNLFYMSALGCLLRINLDDVLDHEMKKMQTLGFFNMS